jgi:DNA-binding MarR family transcriptional regulator
MSICDCGDFCIDARQGCDRCRELDGKNLGEASIIAALRELGIASPKEIHEYSGICQEHVYRILKRLRERGRV